MNKPITDVLNKLAKLMMDENPQITPADVEDLILRKTIHKVFVDYTQPVAELLTSCGFDNAVFKNSSTAISSGIHPFDKVKQTELRMRISPSFLTNGKYENANGFQMLAYYAKYKKTNIIAIGKSEAIENEIYYPAISKDGELIKVNLGSVKTAGFDFLIIEK